MDKEEFVCPICNGLGYDKNSKNLGCRLACVKCNGHGKLDWLENIFGQSKKQILWHEYGEINQER